MSREQLTDAQLSERVCKALGIERLPKVAWDPLPHYPNVLDGDGFLRVVERLAELYPQSLLDLTRDPIYGYTCKLTIGGVPCKRCFCDTLPRALALAVLEWKARRG